MHKSQKTNNKSGWTWSTKYSIEITLTNTQFFFWGGLKTITKTNTTELLLRKVICSSTGGVCENWEGLQISRRNLCWGWGPVEEMRLRWKLKTKQWSDLVKACSYVDWFVFSDWFIQVRWYIGWMVAGLTDSLLGCSACDDKMILNVMMIYWHNMMIMIWWHNMMMLWPGGGVEAFTWRDNCPAGRTCS